MVPLSASHIENSNLAREAMSDMLRRILALNFFCFFKSIQCQGYCPESLERTRWQIELAWAVRMVTLLSSHVENSNFQSRSKFKAKVVKFTLVSYGPFQRCGPFQTTVGYLSLRLACGRSVHDNTISLALEGRGSM